jgi:broad specificity phosphatase PhoE
MTLLLVRHGEIASNVDRIYAGKSTQGLTFRGIRQAEAAAAQLSSARVHSIYSSPMRRALQTAEIIGNRTGKDVKIEYAFREMELGLWEGRSEKDIAQLYPAEWRIWQDLPDQLNIPGRETLEEVLDRVLGGLNNIETEGQGRNIVIVSHVAVIRVLLLWCSGLSLRLYKTIHVPNARVFTVRTGDCPDYDRPQKMK